MDKPLFSDGQVVEVIDGEHAGKEGIVCGRQSPPYIVIKLKRRRKTVVVYAEQIRIKGK